MSLSDTEEKEYYSIKSSANVNYDRVADKARHALYFNHILMMCVPYPLIIGITTRSAGVSAPVVSLGVCPAHLR